jgi:inosine-uridine nucleoside N-ribohydrolase
VGTQPFVLRFVMAARVMTSVLILAGGALSGCQPQSERSSQGDEASATTDSRQSASSEPQRIGPTDVWLDVDPAIGLPSAEVDDGLMMIQVFHSPELRTRGVSVVFGNTSLDKAVPIAAQLGEATEAVTAMAEALAEAPMTILAVGPVTNVGSLVQLHPELHDRIERIVMVAARRVGQSFRTGDPSNLPHRDFNFELDPDAMQAILDTEIPLTFAPWEVSSHVWIRSADLEALAKRSQTGAWVAEHTATWVERWRDNLGVDGFNPFDTLAAGLISHPRWIESEEVGVWIEEGEDDRQPGEIKPYLYVAPVLGEEPDDELRTATYAYLPDPQFKAMLLDRLASPPG